MFNCPYVGPYEGYVSLPFLIVWRNTMRALVYRNAFFGSLAVAALYRLARRLFALRSVALMAALLLANAAWFVAACRFGVFNSVVAMAIGLLAFADFSEWLDDENHWAAVRAFAWLGLGSCTSACFWGILSGLAVCALVYRGRVSAAWERARSKRRGFTIFCAASFLIWTVPMLIANMTGWMTVGFFLSCFQRHGPDSLFNGAALASRFWGRLWQLRGIETASDWIGILAGRPSGVANPILGAPTALIAGVLALEAVASYFSESRRANKILAVLLLIIATYVIMSLFSPDDFLTSHLYLIMPLFYLCAAALPCYLPGPKGRPLAWLLTTALLIASAIQSRAVLDDLRRGLEQTAGVGVESSSAVLDLTEWLKNRPSEKPVLLEWRNFANNVLYFGGGVVDPISIGWDEASRDFFPNSPNSDVLADILHAQPTALFIAAYCHAPCAPDAQGKSVLPAFREHVRKMGRKASLVKSFLSRDGQVVFEAYHVSVR